MSYSINSNSEFNSHLFSLGEVFSAIVDLKSSFNCGPDGIPAYFIKQCVYSLSKPIQYIFNLSLSSGVSPSYWKNSYVTPIYKSGDRSEVTNYRGVCIQSALAKLLDFLITQQLRYIAKQSLSSFQHGFIEGRLILTNFLEYQNFIINSFENDSQVDSFYGDLPKAFDRVNLDT